MYVRTNERTNERLIDYSLYSHDGVLAAGLVVVARRGWLGLVVLPRFYIFCWFLFLGLPSFRTMPL